MFRWRVLLAILIFSAATPAYSQNWMSRYLQERREKAEAKAQAKAKAKADAEAAAKARDNAAAATPAIDSPAEGQPAPEATSLSDVVSPAPAAAAAPSPSASAQSMQPEATFDPSIEVRRAVPVHRSESSESQPTLSPAPAPVPKPPLQAPPQPQAARTSPEPTFDPSIEVRRAIPVQPSQAEPSAAAATVQPDSAREPKQPEPPNPPEQTTRSAQSAPVGPPQPAQSTPTAQAQSAQTETAQTQAQTQASEPDATPAPPDTLNPASREIRLTPGATSAPADVAQFLLANDYYTKKQYDRAAPEFERYLSLYTAGADRQAAYFRLAESYRQLGSLNAARQNYEALIYTFQIGDFIGPASYRLAELHYQDKDYSAAVTFFRKASVWVKDPAVVLSAKYYAARSLENLKFTADAIQAYEDVLTVRENNPFREASQLSLVTLLSDSGRKSQALVILNALRTETAKAPVKAEATVRIGLLLLDQHENKKAVAELKSALAMPEIGSWREFAELGLLRVSYNDGKFKEVLDLYKASPKTFSPTALPEVLLVVANSNRQLGNSKEARPLYEQIARDYPNTPYALEAQYQRLVTLYTTDSPDLIPEIDAYLTSNPEANDRRDQLTLMKAESYYKTKQYAAAAPLYASLGSSSLASNLKAEALFKLGWCDAQIGDHPGAIQAFSSFLSQHPGHKLAPMAIAQRGLSYEQSKNYKAALADFNKLLTGYPRAKEREFALQHKALILGQQDENRGMVDTFTLLLKEYPKSQAAGQANYWIGLTAFQAKNYKEAIPPLQAARKLDKEFAGKSTALILAAEFNLGDREGLATEVDNAGPETKVPSEIRRWLGGEYLKSNEPAKAEKYLAKLTGSAGESEAVADDWLNLGRARAGSKKWTEAEEAIQTYLKKATEPIPRSTGYLVLGQAQMGAGKFSEARESANHALELQPEGRLNALGRMLSGDITLAQKDYDGAARLFLSIALVYDDPVITPQALEKAYLAYKQAGNDPQAAKVLNDLQTKYPEYRLRSASNDKKTHAEPSSH